MYRVQVAYCVFEPDEPAFASMVAVESLRLAIRFIAVVFGAGNETEIEDFTSHVNSVVKSSVRDTGGARIVSSDGFIRCEIEKQQEGEKA